MAGRPEVLYYFWVKHASPARSVAPDVDLFSSHILARSTPMPKPATPRAKRYARIADAIHAVNIASRSTVNCAGMQYRGDTQELQASSVSSGQPRCVPRVSNKPVRHRRRRARSSPPAVTACTQRWSCCPMARKPTSARPRRLGLSTRKRELQIRSEGNALTLALRIEPGHNTDQALRLQLHPLALYVQRPAIALPEHRCRERIRQHSRTKTLQELIAVPVLQHARVQ